MVLKNENLPLVCSLYKILTPRNFLKANLTPIFKHSIQVGKTKFSQRQLICLSLNKQYKLCFIQVYNNVLYMERYRYVNNMYELLLWDSFCTNPCQFVVSSGRCKESKPTLSQLMLPLLNCIQKSIIWYKITVLKFKICHWRSVVATFEPSSYCISFVCESICSNEWIFHNFLNQSKAFQ